MSLANPLFAQIKMKGLKNTCYTPPEMLPFPWIILSVIILFLEMLVFTAMTGPPQMEILLQIKSELCAEQFFFFADQCTVGSLFNGPQRKQKQVLVQQFKAFQPSLGNNLPHSAPLSALN